ncbi:MAG: translation initiation factor [Flavobacteriales bacterium]
MGKRKQGRNRGDNDGMVYSTNPGFSWDEDDDPNEEGWTPEECATLYVSLDRKQRAGKPVTLVEGFDGPASELLLLGKAIKQQCGVGGSVKEGCILVQGDHRDKVVKHLESLGYATKRKGG